MTRDDCKKIIDSIELIRHFANGGEIEHCLHDYKGKFVRWCRCRNSILLSCLGSYRIAKPHLVLTPDGVKLSNEAARCNGEHLQ